MKRRVGFTNDGFCDGTNADAAARTANKKAIFLNCSWNKAGVLVERLKSQTKHDIVSMNAKKRWRNFYHVDFNFVTSYSDYAGGSVTNVRKQKRRQKILRCQSFETPTTKKI
jgi:hypothetical protein